jgi:hypothetical protein
MSSSLSLNVYKLFEVDFVLVVMKLWEINWNEIIFDSLN